MALALSLSQSAPSCSEHDLVAAVRRGDDRAFETLYARYRARIGAFVYGMVGDHGRAEDITQEVFISALRRIRASERPILFKPWIYQVAKNACIDDFRRARREQSVPLEGDDELAGRNPRLIARVPTPDVAIESKQQFADLRGAFRGLSEHHHKIIVLRELEGLSYAQIGEQLGMSQAVVESTLFRARRRLGEEYEDLVSGRRCERVQSVISQSGGRPLRGLGIKERRLVQRHLAHCQPCRRHARRAGVEDGLVPGSKLVGKIAALLPVPVWLRWRRGTSGGSEVAAPSHSLSVVQSAQTFAASVDPSSLSGLGRAAAAVATIVVAGAGGGIVASLATNSAPHRAAPRVAASAGASGAGAAGSRAGRAPGGRRAASVTSPLAGGRSGTTVRITRSDQAAPATSASVVSPSAGTTSATTAGGSAPAGGTRPAAGSGASGAGAVMRSPVTGLPKVSVPAPGVPAPGGVPALPGPLPLPVSGTSSPAGGSGPIGQGIKQVVGVARGTVAGSASSLGLG